MKKTLILLVAITMIFASCSKEKKLNRKLDGNWSAVSVSNDGTTTAISAPMFITISFGKDKKDNGTFTFSQSDGTDSYTRMGTYTLSGDKFINLTQTSPKVAVGVWIVKEYSKKELILIDEFDLEYVFKKK